MGNQCNTKPKKKETSNANPKSSPHSRQTGSIIPLSFIIEIDKIKCKNLTNVKYIFK